MSEVVDLTETDHQFSLWIDKAPFSKPSISHGRGRGGKFRAFFDNRAQQRKAEITAIVQEAARAAGHVKMPREKPVAVVLWCCVRRPDSDFISRTRGCGRLKPEAISDDNTMVAIKPDNDNLAKLLLDALTGVLCADDAQIVDLRVHKLRDNVGLCEGRIAMEVDVFKKSVAETSPNF